MYEYFEPVDVRYFKIQKEIEIYPNPISNGEYLAIENINRVNGIIEIYNVNGNKISSRIINNRNNKKVKIENLPTGIYILKINKRKVKLIVN